MSRTTDWIEEGPSSFWLLLAAAFFAATYAVAVACSPVSPAPQEPSRSTLPPVVVPATESEPVVVMIP